MNGIPMSSSASRIGAVCGSLSLLPVALYLAACSSGEGVSIGDGQDADPVVVDFPIAYVRAPLQYEENDDGEMILVESDVRELIDFNYGADLFYRDRASPSSEAVNVTGDLTQGLYAVKDVEIAYDGSTVLFAMRGPVDENNDLDDEEQPTWNIWEYDIGADELRRVIASDLSAELGHDLDPHYLPDGRIIFTSTRQVRSKAVLLDEGKPQYSAQDEDDNEPAFVLHVMNDDGTGIEQVSFNQSHDMDPSVLSNGQVVFSRWDHAPGNDAIDVYRMNPDGSALELLYGKESHDTGTNGATIQFTQPREIEDGRIMALARPFSDTAEGGDLILIDTVTYLENTQPTRDFPGLTGPAQSPVTGNEIVTEPDTPSPAGRYRSVYPIQDGTGRLLVSWSQCRLTDAPDPLPDPDADPMNPAAPVYYPCSEENLSNPAYVEADPIYGLWMYDPRDDTQAPVVPPEDGYMFTEVVSADPRPTPPVILDSMNNFTGDSDLVAEGAGVIHIRSVYDFDGGAVADINALADPAVSAAADRPARFLRVVKPVSMPDEDTLDFDDTAFGVSEAQGMREILGYVPVEPDGSVMVKIPADVAFAISILDGNGRRISPRHNNWLQLRPGQYLECNGCHVPDSDLSHGRFDAFAPVWAGAQSAGTSYYPGTVDELFVGEIGETMAEVRARVSCATDGCSSIEPSVNLAYEDIWTDPVTAGRMPDEPFSYDYVNTDPDNPGLSTPPPVATTCIPPLGSWSADCRIVVNYETHIHPLWSLPRPQFDLNGNPLLDQNGQPVTATCTNCHNIVDPAGATIVPAGQLDLSDGQSILEPDHFKSYQELLVDNDALTLDANGNLTVQLIQTGIDPDTGLPIIEPLQVESAMSVAGANASDRFFVPFETGRSHEGYLTDAELRLISEWLDVGAQYYNNPFDAPIN